MIIRYVLVISFLTLVLPYLFQLQLVQRIGTEELHQLRQAATPWAKLTFSYAKSYLIKYHGFFQLEQAVMVIGLVLVLACAALGFLGVVGIAAAYIVAYRSYQMGTAAALLAALAVVVYRAYLKKE